MLGHANCFGNVKPRLIKKSSVVLRQNAVKKYAYLERCYGSAQIRRQSVYPFVEPAKWNWDVGAEFRISI